MRIAIGHDLIEKHTDGNPQSFSALWKAHADARGIEAEVVDALAPGSIETIRGFDAFIWRYNFRLPWLDAAPRIMRAVEEDLGLPVWPPRVLRETFENKSAQAYLLEALGVPHPKTWVFWREAEALARLDDLPFPLVVKLSRGVQSDGVALVRDRAEARAVIDRMFTFGLGSMNFLRDARERRFGRYSAMVAAMRRGRFKGIHERGYVIFQEFIPGNAFDTRLMLQGGRVLALRRHNRKGDFRASGSNQMDYDAAAISPAAVERTFELAEAMQVPSLVADVIFRGTEALINEFSYSTQIHGVRPCRGHWRRLPGGVERVEADVDWPLAIFDDFVAGLSAAMPTRSTGQGAT